MSRRRKIDAARKTRGIACGAVRRAFWDATRNGARARRLANGGAMACGASHVERSPEWRCDTGAPNFGTRGRWHRGLCLVWKVITDTCIHSRCTCIHDPVHHHTFTTATAVGSPQPAHAGHTWPLELSRPAVLARSRWPSRRLARRCPKPWLPRRLCICSQCAPSSGWRNRSRRRADRAQAARD